MNVFKILCTDIFLLYYALNLSQSCLCDVTLSAYPHRAGLKNMPGHGGIRTYDLWNTSPMLFLLSYAVRSVRVCDISEHWASIPKVVGSNPAVARHIFQACPVWICTQSNITQTSYSPEYITPTQQISQSYYDEFFF